MGLANLFLFIERRLAVYTAIILMSVFASMYCGATGATMKIVGMAIFLYIVETVVFKRKKKAQLVCFLLLVLYMQYKLALNMEAYQSIFKMEVAVIRPTLIYLSGIVAVELERASCKLCFYGTEKEALDAT